MVSTHYTRQVNSESQVEDSFAHSLTNQDSGPTRRRAARPIPEGMTIFCLFMV